MSKYKVPGWHLLDPIKINSELKVTKVLCTLLTLMLKKRGAVVAISCCSSLNLDWHPSHYILKFERRNGHCYPLKKSSSISHNYLQPLVEQKQLSVETT